MRPYRRQLHRREGQGHPRYLTCSCRHRLPLFVNDRIKDEFVHHLSRVQELMEFPLFAWVVMPEHFHLLLRPATHDQTVTQILRRLKASFARRIVARWRQLDAPVLVRITDEADRPRFWQPGGGYDRNEVSEEEILEKIEYIHANPVRRGLVQLPIEYRWSSFRYYDGRREYTGPAISPLA